MPDTLAHHESERPVPSSSSSPIRIRRAHEADWPAIWSIFRAVVARGDTYMYDPDTSEAGARRT